MNKKIIDEKQLLAEAKAWFEQKHEKSPKECGVKFIKVWYKPTPFRKTIAVVFAPTEKIGKAFIWEQNVIFRLMKNTWILGLVFVGFFYVFIQALVQNNKDTMVALVISCVHYLFVRYYSVSTCG